MKLLDSICKIFPGIHTSVGNSQDFFFRKVAYTRHDVPWFVEQLLYCFLLNFFFDHEDGGICCSETPVDYFPCCTEDNTRFESIFSSRAQGLRMCECSCLPLSKSAGYWLKERVASSSNYRLLSGLDSELELVCQGCGHLRLLPPTTTSILTLYVELPLWGGNKSVRRLCGTSKSGYGP
jgi:hypothetical protein